MSNEILNSLIKEYEQKKLLAELDLEKRKNDVIIHSNIQGKTENQMGLIAISSLMLLGGMYLMIAFAWWLLQIIANWRIFTKAGEAGWKSIIPIYGDYISYKIAWQPAYFWLTLVLGIVSSCLQGTLETNDSLMISMIIVLIKIILAIISIMYSVKLARAFGRGTGFAIGLIFLQPIFMLILGFGDDRYYGADK